MKTATALLIVGIVTGGCVSSYMKTIKSSHPDLHPASVTVVEWGKPEVVRGKYGKAVRVWSDNAAILEFSWPPSGCLEFWYKTPDHFDKFESVLWGSNTAFLNHSQKNFGAWEDTGWRFAMWGGRDWIQTKRVGGRPVENTWYHVAAVWDKKGIYLYINGELIGSGEGRIRPAGNQVYLGVEPAQMTPTQWGSPKVFDEVQLWKPKERKLPLLAGDAAK